MVTFFGILMVSMAGVDVLGNRPVAFLLGDVTPGIAFLTFLLGVGLIRLASPRRPPDDSSALSRPSLA